MKIETVRKNSEPFGTEYSCMMAIVLDGKLVVLRSKSKEFKEVEKIIRASSKLATRGSVKQAKDADLAFFMKQLMAAGGK